MKKIIAIFVISAIMASIWNVFIKFRWHDEKLTSDGIQSFSRFLPDLWVAQWSHLHGHCWCSQGLDIVRVFLLVLTWSHNWRGTLRWSPWNYPSTNLCPKHRSPIICSQPWNLSRYSNLLSSNVSPRPKIKMAWKLIDYFLTLSPVRQHVWVYNWKEPQRHLVPPCAISVRYKLQY